MSSYMYIIIIVVNDPLQWNTLGCVLSRAGVYKPFGIMEQ